MTPALEDLVGWRVHIVAHLDVGQMAWDGELVAVTASTVVFTQGGGRPFELNRTTIAEWSLA